MDCIAATNHELRARQRIASHIARVGNLSLKLTHKSVKVWWKILNAAVFMNTLPYPKAVTIKTYKAIHAKIVAEDAQNFELYIHDQFDTRHLFLTVLVHEMVHVWELVNGHEMSHGKTFKQWTQHIKTAVGLELTREI